MTNISYGTTVLYLRYVTSRIDDPTELSIQRMEYLLKIKHQLTLSMQKRIVWTEKTISGSRAFVRMKNSKRYPVEQKMYSAMNHRDRSAVLRMLMLAGALTFK